MRDDYPWGSGDGVSEDQFSNPVVAARVARFYIESPKQQCSPTGVANKMSSGEGPLHPPSLVEDALSDLVDVGALRVALDSDPAGRQQSVKLYALADYMTAQQVVMSVDSVSNST